MRPTNIIFALGALTPKVLGASNSFAGSNLYFLQGLSPENQDIYINKLASYGAKVVRVWVNSQPGSGCQKGSWMANAVPQLENQLGKYNIATLDALDKVLFKLQKAGLKAIISPHDANKLCGANMNGESDPYCDRWGPGYFYEQQEAFAQYDKRLSFILNYVSPSSGKAWKNWKEAIMAFDLQNEPMAPKTAECNTAQGDRYGWICGRAAHLRSLLGANNPIKVASGGIGGDISHGCNLVAQAVNCPQLDIISIHRYAGAQAANPNQWANSARSWIAQAKGKLVMVEEWGVREADAPSEYPAQANDINAGAIPWLYWQILPPYKCSGGGTDGFNIYMDGTTDVAGPMRRAASKVAAQNWSGTVVTSCSAKKKARLI